MTLQSGKMYRPTAVAFDVANNRVYVVEKFNHRISKWKYTQGGVDFTLDAGQLTGITITDGGTGYSVLDLLNIGPPTLDIANPVNAVAEVSTVAAGVITGITIADSGNGYDPNNLPTVDAPTSGTPAILSAVVSTPWGNNGDGTTGEAAPVTSTTDNALDNPSDMVLDVTNSLLYVTDTLHNRVRVVNPSTGAFTTSIGQGGRGTSDFYRPSGIAINAGTDTRVVIADEFNHRAVLYTTSGGTLDSPAVLPNPTPLPFNGPHGMVFDVTSNEFNVTDSLRGVISSYNVSGVFQGQYGTPGTESIELFFPGSGQGILDFSSDTIFADTRNNALKKMNNETIGLLPPSSGTPLAGTAGTSNGQLYYPESVATFTDSQNYFLAANTLNNRVEVYTGFTSLEFLTNFGLP